MSMNCYTSNQLSRNNTARDTVVGISSVKAKLDLEQQFLKKSTVWDRRFVENWIEHKNIWRQNAETAYRSTKLNANIYTERCAEFSGAA